MFTQQKVILNKALDWSSGQVLDAEFNNTGKLVKINLLCRNNPMFMEYEDGSSVITSAVDDYFFESGNMLVKTLNGIYVFKLLN